MNEKARGLIFNAALAPGVIAGTVRVTSRMSGLKCINKHPDEWDFCCYGQHCSRGGLPERYHFISRSDPHVSLRLPCAFRVGERRYVKEAWYCDARGGLLGYPADGDRPHGEPYRIGRANYMPAAIARTWIEILSVRPARCREITEDEIAASIDTFGNEEFPVYRNYDVRTAHHLDWLHSPTGAYSTWWNKLNAKRRFPWSLNAWVWRIAFRTVQP
jgi:hypothetical protein